MVPIPVTFSFDIEKHFLTFYLDPDSLGLSLIFKVGSGSAHTQKNWIRFRIKTLRIRNSALSVPCDTVNGDIKKKAE
jgi:hypothetical protein